MEALGAAALVRAVGVVDVQLANQVALEAGVLGRQVAGESRLPAFLQQGLLDALHAAVGGGATGADVDVLDAELSQGPVELLGSVLGSVVSHRSLQLPAALGELLGDSLGQGRGPVGRRVLGSDVELGPGV